MGIGTLRRHYEQTKKADKKAEAKTQKPEKKEGK